MATITDATDARSKAKRLLEEAVEAFHISASGQNPRGQAQAVVAQALLALADSMDKEAGDE